MCKQFCFEPHLKLCRGNFPGQKSVVNCPGKNFMRGSCPGVVVQGGIIKGKIFVRQKFRGAIVLGVNCPLGGGAVVQGGMSRYHKL